MSSQGVVLVTGASSFVGAAVILELIEKNYKVKGTVRTQAKADAFIKKHPDAKPHIEWTIVKDVAEPGAFDDAVKGVDYILHLASPFHFKPEDNERDMLRPAVEGTKGILKAAKTQPGVKHVTITSSFASVVDVSKAFREGYTYSHEDWNPAEWDEAVKSDQGPFVYCASKKFAEKAAWDFMEQEKPHFALTTICPPMIMGPPLQPIDSMDKLNESADEVWVIINGSTKKIEPAGFPVWTDVRDVAHLHVASLTNPKARNQRYLCIAGHFSNEQIAYTVAKAFPAQASRIPKSDNSPPPPHYATDSSKAEKDFGIKWIPFEKSIVDTANELYKLEKELKA